MDQPKFGLTYGPHNASYDAESFTEEQARQNALRRAAAERVLFETDLTRLDEANTAALYRSVTKNLYGFEDTDGYLCFRDRRSTDMKRNVEMLRDALSGKNTTPLMDPDREAYEKADRAGKIEIARKREGIVEGLKRKWPGWLGLAMHMGPTATITGSPVETFVQESDEERAARLRDDEDKLLANFEEKMQKNEPLLTLLSYKDALTDRAGWVLTKSVTDGHLDATDLATLPDPEQRRRVMAGFDAVMGDRRNVRILGVPTDVSTGTAGDRVQMMLYGAQNAFLSLVTEPFRMLKDYGTTAWKYVAEKDAQARRDLDEMLRLESNVGEANERPLPTGGFWGEAGQVLAENVHWFAAYLTKAWKVGQLAKVAAQTERALATEEAIRQKAGMAQICIPEGVQLASIVARYQKMSDKVRKIEAGLKADKALYGTELMMARSMTYSAFANEFIRTCDAAGVSRDESVPLSVAVGIVNDRIEQIEVPFLSEDIGRSQLRSIGLNSLVHNLKQAEIGKYLKNRLSITIPAGIRVAASEGAVEEPLQQLVIEHFKVLAEDLDALRDKDGKPLTEANKKLVADQLEMVINGTDLKTYVDTTVDMLPAMVGYLGTTGTREQVRDVAGKLWDDAKKRRKGQYDQIKTVEEEGLTETEARTKHLGVVLDNHFNESEEKASADEKVKDKGEGEDNGKVEGEEKDESVEDVVSAANQSMEERARRPYDLVAQAREIYDRAGGKFEAAGLLMNEMGLPQEIAELAVDTFADTDLEILAGNRGVKSYVQGVYNPSLTDKTFEALGGVKGSIKHDSKKGITIVTLQIGEGGAELPGVKKGTYTVAYKQRDSYLIKDDGTIDYERLGEDIKTGSALGQSWDQMRREYEKEWKDLSEIERKRIAITRANGLKEQGGPITIRDDETGQEITVPVDAVIFLATGRTKDVAYQVLPRGVAEMSETGVRATGWTVYHETWHQLWKMTSGMLSDEEKRALASQFPRVDTTKDGWEKDLDEAMAYEFEKWGAGQYVSPKLDSKFKQYQAYLGGLLESMGITNKDVVKYDEDGNAVGEYALADFYRDVMDGKAGSANMRIPMAATSKASGEAQEETQTRFRKVSDGKIPVEPKKEHIEAAAEAEVEEGEGEGKGEVEAEADKAKGNGEGEGVRAAKNDWDFGDRIVLENPKAIGVKYHCKLRVVNLMDVKNSFIPGVDNPYQNRDTKSESAAEEAEAAVAEMAPKILFKWTGRISPTFGDSTVVVDKDLYVIARNHGSEAARRAALANNDAWRKYKADTLAEAEARGLTIDDNALQYPFLVAELESVEGSEGMNAQQLGIASNRQVVRLSGESGNARNDVNSMRKLGTVDKIAVKENGEIDLSKQETLNAIKQFGDMSDIPEILITVKKLEGGKVVDAKKLSKIGEARTKNAIIALLLGGEEDILPIMESLAEDEQYDFKNEKSALVKVAADLIKLADERPIYNIGNSLKRALGMYIEWRKADTLLREKNRMTTAQWSKKPGYPTEKIVGQLDLYRNDDPVARLIFNRLAESRKQQSYAANGDPTAAGQERAVKYITDWFSKFAERARNVNVETDDLLGMPPASSEEILGMAFSVASAPTIKLGKKFLDDEVGIYGTTKKAHETQAILPDGRALKGKGITMMGVESFGHTYLMDDVKRHAARALEGAEALKDDAAMAQYLEQERLNDLAAWNALAKMRVIRVTYGGQGLQFFGTPTKDQSEALWDFVEDALKDMGEDDTLIVDFSDEWGETPVTKQYSPKASPRAVIEDARGWYENGERPVNAVSRGSFSVGSIEPTHWKDTNGYKHVSITELRPVRGRTRHWVRDISIKPNEDFDRLQEGIMVGTRLKKSENGFAPTLSYYLRPENRVEVGMPTYSNLLSINGDLTDFGEKSVSGMVARDTKDGKYVVLGMESAAIRDHLTTDTSDPLHQQSLFFVATGDAIGFTDEERRHAAIDLLNEMRDEVARMAERVRESGAQTVMPFVTRGILDEETARAVSAQAGVPVGPSKNVALVAFAGHAGTGLVERVKTAAFEGGRVAAIQTVCHEGAEGHSRFFANDIGGNADGMHLLNIDGAGDARRALLKMAKWANREWNAADITKLDGFDAALSLLSLIPRKLMNRMDGEALLRQMSLYKQTQPIYERLKEENRNTRRARTRIISDRYRFRDLGIRRIYNVGSLASLDDGVVREFASNDLFRPVRMTNLEYALRESKDNPVAVQAAKEVLIPHVMDVVNQIEGEMEKGGNISFVIPHREGAVYSALENVFERYVRGILKSDGYTSLNQARYIDYTIQDGMPVFNVKPSNDDQSMRTVVLQFDAGDGTVAVELANAIRRANPHPVFRKMHIAAMAANHDGKLFDATLTDAEDFGKLTIREIEKALGYGRDQATYSEAISDLDGARTGTGYDGVRVVPVDVSGGTVRSEARKRVRGGRQAPDRGAQRPARATHDRVGGVRHVTLPPRGEQKRGDTNYPNDGVEISEARFSIGGDRKKLYRDILAKKRPDLVVEKVDKILSEIDHYNNPKKEKLALHWIVTGAIMLPEDEYKVDQAMKTAENAKVDPFQFENPYSIVTKYEKFVPKGPIIDPDTVPELKNRTEIADGIVVYDVEEKEALRTNIRKQIAEIEDPDVRKEFEKSAWMHDETYITGQVAMRKIINSHWGKNARPWCLLRSRKDGSGELDGDARYYWNHYSALPKRVAFKDGKLLAFMATDGHQGGIMADDEIVEQWWDRNDKSFDGIPVTGRINGDPLGRSGTLVYNSHTKESHLEGSLYRGNEDKGVYEEWEDRDTLVHRRTKNEEGKTVLSVHWHPNGSVRSVKRHDVAALWEEDGHIESYNRFTGVNDYLANFYNNESSPGNIRTLSNNIRTADGYAVETLYLFYDPVLGELLEFRQKDGKGDIFNDYSNNRVALRVQPYRRGWMDENGRRIKMYWSAIGNFEKLVVHDKDGKLLFEISPNFYDGLDMRFKYTSFEDFARAYKEKGGKQDLEPIVKSLARFEYHCLTAARMYAESAKKNAPKRPNIPALPGLKDDEIHFSVGGMNAVPTLEGRKKDLIALHNLTSRELMNAIRLGGLAMPSVAVTKDSMGHVEYGPISLLMKPSAIDPKRSAYNRVYSGDAWTPTFPEISLNIDKDVKKRVNATLRGLLEKAGVADVFENDLYKFVDDDYLERALARFDNPGEGLASERFAKAAYLASLGTPIQRYLMPDGTVDIFKTKDGADRMVYVLDPKYRAWLNDLYQGIIKNRGIRNEADLFNPDGTRRTWWQLHDDVTLYNVVKAMRSQQEQGRTLGGTEMEGASAIRLNSLDDVVAREWQLKDVPQDKYEQMRELVYDKFYELVHEYAGTQDVYEPNQFIAIDEAKNQMLDIYIEKRGNEMAMLKPLNEYGFHANEDFVKRFVAVMRESGDMYTRYFEAKPMRAVGFGEVAAAIVPAGLFEKVEGELKRVGVKVYTYNGNDSSSRLAVTNQAADDTEAAFSVAPVYTGSAYDYSKPSLLKIGTGEGNQTFGWGLYGTSVRGIANHYSGMAFNKEKELESDKDRYSRMFAFLSDIEERGGGFYGDNVLTIIADEFDAGAVDTEDVIGSLEQKMDLYEQDGREGEINDAIEFCREHKDEIDAENAKNRLKSHVYEQTFFTNREPGDESHLLSWYEPVSKENLNRFIDQVKKEGYENELPYVDDHGTFRSTNVKNKNLWLSRDTGKQLYDAAVSITHSQKAASEFLARAGIDGIKYPSNSLGGVPKEKDVQWNYVSFRDDNIRVDRKWREGEEVPVDPSLEAEAEPPSFSVANRKYTWKDYPNLPGRVIHATQHNYLVGHDNPYLHRLYENFKIAKCYGDDGAKRMATEMTHSSWMRERYLGYYLLGKHFGDYDAALKAVRYHFRPGQYGLLNGLTRETNRPIRWVYVHNSDGLDRNRMALAFADSLAEQFGGSVDAGITKVSDGRNTGASLQARAGRNFEWFGTVDPEAVYFIVDDVWTTGSTTVSLLEYLKSHGGDVRGIVTIATAAERDHIVPEQDDWDKFLGKAHMRSLNQVAKVIGFDPEKLTGSELYAYGVKGKSGKAGLAKWFEQAFGRIEIQGDLFGSQAESARFSVARPRWQNDDDMIVAALAAGMVVNPKEPTATSKSKTAYGFFRKHRKETEQLVMKAHPEIANDYGEVTRLAHMLMMRAQLEARDIKKDLERGVSESEIVKRLPKKLHPVYREKMAEQRKAGGELIATGIKARETIEKRWQDRVTKAVKVQTGVEPELFEQWAGVDLTETLLKALSNPKEMRAAPDKGDNAIASEPPDNEDLKGAGGDAGGGASKALSIIAVEEPRRFAQYLMGQMEKYWRETNHLGNGSGVRVWSDAVALQFARKTAQNVFSKIIRSIVYSGAREVALANIAKFQYAQTPAALESLMTFVGEVVHARHIRETKEEMLKNLETLLKTKLGASGRFKPDREELRRKVTAELEMRARVMRQYLWLSKEKAADEAARLMDEGNKLYGQYSEAEKDVEQSRKYLDVQRRLAILREFGGLKDKTLGEIEDAFNYWSEAEQGSHEQILIDMREREARTMAAADALAAAVVNPKSKTAVEPGLKANINNYLVGHMGFVAMLQDMTRYAKGDAKATAYAVIGYIAREIQKSGDRTNWDASQQSDAFMKAVEAIYHRPFRKVMSEMNAEDERFAPFMGEHGGKKDKPTKARAMQLLVSLLQAKKPGDDYYENAVRHNRHKQAPEIAQLLSAEDLNMINWIGRWYEENRQGLSDVSEALFGMGVHSENANYFPVKMKMEKQGLEAAEGVGWTIFPRALTPRVRNERDFDTRADIFSMWQTRMQEAAQWKAHAKLGLEMRGIFGRSHLQEAIVANHGAKINRLMLEYITDILTGSSPSSMGESGVEKAADWVRGWTALTALGGNVGVMFKQTTSIPAFGFEIGLKNTARHIVTAFTPAGLEAMRKIWNSSQRKVRWDTGSSEAVANALRSNNVSAIKKLFQASMITNKLGDAVPGLVVGQGIYRDLVEQGMSDEDAMAEVWMLIERTQQSSRLENQTKLQRRNKLGRLMYQFMTTQQQYLSYELKALREFMARPGIDTAGKFAGTVALNHFILSSLYYWMGQLYNAMLGQEPPEDQFKDWMITNLLGPFGSLFVLGFLCQSTLTRALKGYYDLRSAEMLPMEGYIKRNVADGADLVEAVFDNTRTWDDVLEEGLQWLNDLSPVLRDARKIDKNYVRPEAYPKKRRGRRGSSRGEDFKR